MKNTMNEREAFEIEGSEGWDASLRRSGKSGYALVNGTVVTPFGVLDGVSVVVEEGRITAITGRNPGAVRRIDALGLLVLPGFVDLHSDALEGEIQPRPGGRFPVDMALVELDKRLASCGVTTMYHSLSFSTTDKNPLRKADTARSIVLDIHRMAPSLRVRNRVHARFEMIDAECAPVLEGLIRDDRVHLFSLMDHTPGQGQFASMEHFKAYYGTVDQMTAEELDHLAARRIEARSRLDLQMIERMTRLCRDRGVPMASHDDDSAAKVRWVSDLGVGLCEFPVNAEAARSAHDSGLHVLMGAPNVLRGESLTGNLSGREAVRHGWCDIIGSDYSPASILHALFALHRGGLGPLHELVNRVSLNPARAMGMDREIGAVEIGRRADLLLVDPGGAVPRILRTFVDGEVVFSSGLRGA